MFFRHPQILRGQIALTERWRSFRTNLISESIQKPEGFQVTRFSGRLLLPVLVGILAINIPAANGAAPQQTAQPAGSGSSAGFRLLHASSTGVTFTNFLSNARAAENQIRLNGSGVALGDMDGDGLCDVYLCRLEGPNALFRNLGGWRFENVAARSGVECQNQYSTGSVLADVDGDRDLDLLVTGIGTGTRLFLNDGRGKFTENQQSGLIPKLGATSMALADIDGDGDLDLYVANYRTTTIRSTGFAVMQVGDKTMPLPEDRFRLEFTPEGRVLEHGEPDILYRNEGGGKFSPVRWNDGTFLDDSGQPLKSPPLDWALSVMFRDLNGDGAPDIYVCNDFHSPDRIWMNDGSGRFKGVARHAIRKQSTFSMSVDFGDLNRDGLEDFFVADMLSRDPVRRLMQMGSISPYHALKGEHLDQPQFGRNTLQLNRGDGTYAEIALFSGLGASDWTWSAMLLDVDLDGFEDLLCSTGHMFDTQDLDAEARIQARGPWRREDIPQKLLMFPPMPQRKVAFRNQGNLSFVECGAAWGFDQTGVSHGMALGDLDNDGDLDLVVNNLNQPAGLYRNEATSPRIAVRLKGIPPNTHGVGAVIQVEGAAVPQSQVILAGGRYLSGDEMIRVFAGPQGTNHARIRVKWRSGSVSELGQVKNNQVCVLDESEARKAGPAPAPGGLPAPIFEDVSQRIAHRHQDEDHNDFAWQPLLPGKLSSHGPGVAWIDSDSDGDDDLFVGAGRGGPITRFKNRGDGTFEPAESIAVPAAPEGTGGLAAARIEDKPLIFAGTTQLDTAETTKPAGLMIGAAPGGAQEPISGPSINGGPVALADVDGDGDLDLFVGSRFVSGRWPQKGDSLIFTNHLNRFTPDESASRVLAGAGLVEAAIFTDLDSDGSPELVLSCSWGPIRIFRNRSGRFSEWNPVVQTLESRSSAHRLSELTGLWKGIAAGDFDGDGRMDLAVCNWGWNSDYQNFREAEEVLARLHQGSNGPINERPHQLLFGDFMETGSIALMEGRVQDSSNRLRPIRGFPDVTEGMPVLRERFASHASFNQSDLQGILGPGFSTTNRLTLNWLATTVFLNRGETLSVIPLDPEAQFAPAFGIAAADFDGDGFEDLVLSQNFFGVYPTESRLDAGRGLLMAGNGKGGFRPLKSSQSGIAVYGEGRGVAVADFNRDGRTDLVLGQNAAETRLYLNRLARSGIRVRLSGPTSNPSGIGATLRPVFKSRRFGATREIHSGSGLGSTDSSIVVLSVPEPEEISEIEVVWPGGKRTRSPVTDGNQEILIRH